MTTDADLSDLKAALYDALIENRQFGRLLAHPQFHSRIMRAVECAYQAGLMRLEDREMEEEIRTVFRRARGLDNQRRLLRGAILGETIADYDHRFESWKREREAANFPFHHIALYNGVRQIASCGRFFDFSRHESVNELDTQSGLQIRGINDSEQEDVLLGSYALAGVRHDGEEQVLPLMNGYTVGLRVIQLDEKTFAIGLRCVESASMEKSGYMQDFTIASEKVFDRISEIGFDSKVERA